MPAVVPAVLLHRTGDISWERQYAACQPHVARHGYRVAAVATSESDAVALVRLGRAQVVVTAIAAPTDGRLATLLEDAGGRLEHCRPPRQRRSSGPVTPASDSTDEIVRAMYRFGGSTDQIARFLDRPVGAVRAILDRLGIRRQASE